MFNIFKKSQSKTVPQSNEESVKTEDALPKKKEPSELFGNVSDQDNAMFAIRKGGSGRR